MLSNPYEAGEQGVSTHKIEMLMLALLHISAWGCLIRSDYNFVLVFFAYFYIVSRKDYISVAIILYLFLLLLLLDLAFFLFVPSAWMSYDENNSVWNNLRPLHGFAIFCSIFVFGLKIPIVYLLYGIKKTLTPAK